MLSLFFHPEHGEEQPHCSENLELSKEIVSATLWLVIDRQNQLYEEAKNLANISEMDVNVVGKTLDKLVAESYLTWEDFCHRINKELYTGSHFLVPIILDYYWKPSDKISILFPYSLDLSATSMPKLTIMLGINLKCYKLKDTEGKQEFIEGIKDDKNTATRQVTELKRNFSGCRSTHTFHGNNPHPDTACVYIGIIPGDLTDDEWYNTEDSLKSPFPLVSKF